MDEFKGLYKEEVPGGAGYGRGFINPPLASAAVQPTVTGPGAFGTPAYSSPPGQAEAAARGFLQEGLASGTPKWVEAKIIQLMNQGLTYDQALGQVRMRTEQARQNYPLTSAGSELAGSVVQGMALPGSTPLRAVAAPAISSGLQSASAGDTPSQIGLAALFGGAAGGAGRFVSGPVANSAARSAIKQDTIGSLRNRIGETEQQIKSLKDILESSAPKADKVRARSMIKELADKKIDLKKTIDDPKLLEQDVDFLVKSIASYDKPAAGARLADARQGVMQAGKEFFTDLPNDLRSSLQFAPYGLAAGAVLPFTNFGAGLGIDPLTGMGTALAAGFGTAKARAAGKIAGTGANYLALKQIQNPKAAQRLAAGAARTAPVGAVAQAVSPTPAQPEYQPYVVDPYSGLIQTAPATAKDEFEGLYK